MNKDQLIPSPWNDHLHDEEAYHDQLCAVSLQNTPEFDYMVHITVDQKRRVRMVSNAACTHCIKNALTSMIESIASESDNIQDCDGQ
jgi:alanyl-tRNA synthetase